MYIYIFLAIAPLSQVFLTRYETFSISLENNLITATPSMAQSLVTSNYWSQKSVDLTSGSCLQVH